MSKYKCRFCVNKSSTMSEWVDHVIVDMVHLKPTMCPHCDKSFSDCMSTIQHVTDRLCQKKIPVTICGYCNGRFKTSRIRSEHELNDCILAKMSNPITWFACLDLFCVTQKKTLDDELVLL